MLPRILDAEPDPETQNLNIEVNDSTDLRGVFDLLTDANTTIFNASLINISSDIDFTTQDLDFESLTASNISQVLDSLPQIGQFSGTLNGSNISNLQTQTAGLFGTITDSAKVNDLVLSDVRMPGMGGIGFVKYVRETLGNRELPVYAVTSDTASIDSCREQGFNAVLMKPFTRANVVALLRRVKPRPLQA